MHLMPAARILLQITALCAFLAVQISGQTTVSSAAATGDGLPVTDSLVIAKCGSCHRSDPHGNMQRISWTRTTPEGWQDALKEMILRQSLSVSPAEARSIVQYLSDSHGLAPDEAKPILYDAERVIQEETAIPSDTLREACSKCHSFARALSWRRSRDEWKQFIDSHAQRYNARSPQDAIRFLTDAAPLHTPAWDAWNARAIKANLTGRWLVSAHLPGHGSYYGEMQLDREGEDDYNVRAALTSVRDGSRVIRRGRATVYGGDAWRGRSQGSQPAGSPDDPLNQAREVLLIAPDQATAEGRWFWGQYQEFGFDVKLRRATSDPVLLGVDGSALKTGSTANGMHLSGHNFPSQITAADLNFGRGVTVRRIVSNSGNEIVAELDVASDAPLGKRDVVFLKSTLAGAVAVYDRIDYIQVVPDSAMASFSDPTHPKGYQQFEAIGYQRGPDGKLHTADDLPLGPVDVDWAIEKFHAAQPSAVDSIGAISPSGLFTPAAGDFKTNFDVWVIATAKNQYDANGAPLSSKSYVVLTVPTYTFNGRQFVRDLDRWVDEGPAPSSAPARP
jgi:quinohemoprotein amine dehydrogenase